jgi:hypothetical protein
MLDMQYKIGDMLQEKDEATHRMLSLLLDQCTDELEALAADEFGEESATERLRLPAPMVRCRGPVIPPTLSVSRQTVQRLGKSECRQDMAGERGGKTPDAP